MPKKLTRKQIVKQDVVKSAVFKIWENIQNYPIHIAGSIIALVSIIIFAYAWVSYSHSKYQVVNEMFITAFNEYQSLNEDIKESKDETAKAAEKEKKYKNIISILHTIQRDYPNTLYAPEALYYLGNVFIKKGNYPKAIESFNECIKKTNDDIIKGLALFSLTKALTYNHQYQEAFQSLEQLEKIESKPVSTEYILYQKALVYKNKGDIEKSKELIQRIKTEFPTSLLIDELENEK